ncbi:glycosyltransferase [Flavobacterium sp.]|uniref:glycosyltransferase n=1 Tax=Flavobacterium sp. TaxID=239 RepID=UPI002631D8E9|nr:glycosyltransferase [Flavobacterium sp.]MDG2430911.1 glycosyltransferase [Flavobacterium sp.]
MRIVQIIDSLEAGGAERMALNYANSLADMIEFSGIVTTRKEGPLLKVIQSNCSYLYLSRKYAIDFKAVFRLRKYIIQHQVEIVHAHGTSFFIATLLKITYPQIKIIWHEHYGARVRQSRFNNVILICCSFFFSAIFVVSKSLELWARQKTFCKQILYIPNFTTCITESSKETVLQGISGKRIVYVANLKNPKNHLVLLEAFEQLLLYKMGWSLHLIGKDYLDDYATRLYDFVKNKNLIKSVFFYDSRPDIKNILLQASIGVLVSTSEGFPVSLLEYGMCALPTLSANVGSCDEIVIANSTGLLFDPNDIHSLKNQLERLVNDEISRRQFGLKLKTWVSKNFSKEVVMQMLITKYADILTK